MVEFSPIAHINLQTPKYMLQQEREGSGYFKHLKL